MFLIIGLVLLSISKSLECLENKYAYSHDGSKLALFYLKYWRTVNTSQETFALGAMMCLWLQVSHNEFIMTATIPFYGVGFILLLAVCFAKMHGLLFGEHGITLSSKKWLQHLKEIYIERIQSFSKKPSDVGLCFIFEVGSILLYIAFLWQMITLPWLYK